MRDDSECRRRRGFVIPGGGPRQDKRMTNLIDGGDWWAMVEERGKPSVVQYWKVIAWQSVDDAVATSNESGLVAWINGRVPVRSDRFGDEVQTWILNHFVQALPERATTSSWA